MTLEEAIKHCEEKAKKLRTEAEQLRDIGEVISNPKQPYNEPVKNCLECAKEHEQLAEWLTELKNMKDCIKTECFKCAKDKATVANASTVERPQGELKEYKPLEVDYNVKSAVENLKTAYWSNDSEKYAQAFVEADQMIVSAICHYGYIVVKGGAE